MARSPVQIMLKYGECTESIHEHYGESRHIKSVLRRGVPQPVKVTVCGIVIHR